jgi:hypothetical protein
MESDILMLQAQPHPRISYALQVSSTRFSQLTFSPQDEYGDSARCDHRGQRYQTAIGGFTCHVKLSGAVEGTALRGDNQYASYSNPNGYQCTLPGYRERPRLIKRTEPTQKPKTESSDLPPALELRAIVNIRTQSPQPSPPTPHSRFYKYHAGNDGLAWLSTISACPLSEAHHDPLHSYTFRKVAGKGTGVPKVRIASSLMSSNAWGEMDGKIMLDAKRKWGESVILLDEDNGVQIHSILPSGISVSRSSGCNLVYGALKSPHVRYERPPPNEYW